MATITQRAQALIETVVLNGPSTAAQRQRLMNIYSAGLPEGYTVADVARVMVNDIRRYLLDKVKNSEAVAASYNAQTNFDANVNTDFPEQP